MISASEDIKTNTEAISVNLVETEIQINDVGSVSEIIEKSSTEEPQPVQAVPQPETVVHESV